MNIKTWYKDETAIYAAEELKKYLDIMHPGFCSDIIVVENAEAEATSGEIKLGLLDDFGLDSSDVSDAFCEDVVYVDIKNGSGIIAGSNIRSILLSVYDYLRSAGCAFLRPRDDGEIIPQRDMSIYSYSYRKKADLVFRTEMIEGAVSYEHLRDTITWMPKVGMNSFMMEMVVPANYISRWYQHRRNTVLEDEKVSFEEIAEMVHKLELHIKKCGLLLQSLGHGYLFEPYGITYKGCKYTGEITDEMRQDIALVNGKRELRNGSVNQTQLCYSNKNVRKKLVDWLVGYVQKKPYIDYLQICLSDGKNNHCECENCMKARISDFYVMLLNGVDAELTRLGIDTRIIFTLYSDTLWPPVYEKINNPDRFCVKVAVGSRDYTKPYDLTSYKGELPIYIRNEYNAETSFQLRIKFLNAWKEAYGGDRFGVTDYHMFTLHYTDPGYLKLTKLWMEDVKTLKKMGYYLGMVNCQTQRSYFPNGLPISAYAATSFDTSTEFEAFCEDYMQKSYGKDYKYAYDYLKEVSNLLGPDVLKSESHITAQDIDIADEKPVLVRKWVDNPEAQANFKKLMKLAREFEPVAKAHLDEEHPTVSRSWKLLYYHTDFCYRYAEILLNNSEGNNDKAEKLLDEMADVFSKIELEISMEFDLDLFYCGTNRRLGLKDIW